MIQQLQQLGMGSRFLNADEVNPENLGPLAQLIGEWRGVIPPDENLLSSGWNTISVPGGHLGQAFVFEVIPYAEVLRFSPVIVQAGNRGPLVNGEQVEQSIFGLIYEQSITSVCTTDTCISRGFGSGKPIHAETGLLLNLGSPNGGYSIARLATIPHGNSLLALGSSSVQINPGIDFFPPSSCVPTQLDGSQVTSLLDYDYQVTKQIQFPGVFPQETPNKFLQTTLQAIVGTGSVTEMTTLHMSTSTPNANGGILNIPFIQTNVNATSMDAIFWLETIEGGKYDQLLQYTQTINLVFPATGQADPIKWPHVTINSLIKITD